MKTLHSRDTRAHLTATYRLQLHADFTFADAAEVVPYIADLGISHLYLSPLLQAAPGSMHGYDVVDHSRVSDDLGGESGLVALAEVAHDHGLGIVCDVVPNHMCIPAPASLNRQLWDVLHHGRAAESARWFDIDWELCDGRLGLPVLGAALDEVIAAGELVIDTVSAGSGLDQAVLRYHDQVFPVAAGTEGGSVADVADRQHYLLGSWRDKRSLLCHRRFFDVDTLIAIRVEDPEVFAASHATLVDLHARRVLDGFRIDHPDGLADPEGYLAQLAAASDGAWVVVEKILSGAEKLPTHWQTAGTTGYDAVTVVQTALCPDTGSALTELWEATGGEVSQPVVEMAAKRQVLADLLAPEQDRLARRARQAADDAHVDLGSDADLYDGLTELLAHVEVYRAYLRPGHQAEPMSLDRLQRLVEHAGWARPDLATTLQRLLGLLTDVDTTSPAGRDLLVRFQQVCGPVMAKGVEDTTFYRYHRLVALNEVGGDPEALGSPGAEPLHTWAAYQRDHHPRAMTTLSTHDTKRSEDVRARLLAVAADPAGWAAGWHPVQRLAHAHEVDLPTAYLLFQTLLGTWPIEPDRLHAYAGKALREAKQHTSWQDPDPAYEQHVHAFVDACLADRRVGSALLETLHQQAADIRAVTLGAKLLQLTLPGVPDVYQGSEQVMLSLVDPDNRRPVDYVDRRERLARLDDAVGGTPRWRDLDDAKLWVTRCALRLRRERPGVFGVGSGYTPLTSSGDVAAFVRSDGDSEMLTAVRRPVGPGSGSGELSVELPSGRWRDVLTGAVHDDGGALFADLPVALLIRAGA